VNDGDIIVVDANVFLRFLVESVSAETRGQADSARTLFQRAAAGEMPFTSNAAVIAEVVFILHSAKHYGRPRAEISDRLPPS
jgi:predicted nucleic acid-binding protein